LSSVEFPAQRSPRGRSQAEIAAGFQHPEPNGASLSYPLCTVTEDSRDVAHPNPTMGLISQ
jgi:hypothetical protein